MGTRSPATHCGVTSSGKVTAASCSAMNSTTTGSKKNLHDCANLGSTSPAQAGFKTGRSWPRFSRQQDTSDSWQSTSAAAASNKSTFCGITANHRAAPGQAIGPRAKPDRPAGPGALRHGLPSQTKWGVCRFRTQAPARGRGAPGTPQAAAGLPPERWRTHQG